MHADKNITVMLVGNKCDLGSMRVVPVEVAKELAQKHGLFFMETSALDSTNVEPAFLGLLSQIYLTIGKRSLVTNGRAESKLEKVNLEGTEIYLPSDDLENRKGPETKKRSRCCSFSQNCLSTGAARTVTFILCEYSPPHPLLFFCYFYEVFLVSTVIEFSDSDIRGGRTIF